MNNRLLLLDLDGTVTTPESGNIFPASAIDQKIIPGVHEKIKQYRAAGYDIVIVSNQGGIEARYKSIDTTIAQFQYVLSLLPEVSHAYFSCEDNYKNKPAWKKFLSNSNIYYRNDAYKVSKYLAKKVNFRALNKAYSIYTKNELPLIFRKPNEGMLFAAWKDFGYPYLNNVVMVGDRTEDKQAADYLECNFIWAKDFVETEIKR